VSNLKKYTNFVCIEVAPRVSGDSHFRSRRMRMPQKGSNTVVICRRCDSPIRIEAAERVADEFAVTCQKCGQRGFFRIKDIKTV
jgi:RNase P subunit RPR2